MFKKMMLAAVSMSALTLYATQASAQATPVYNSPAQAQTYDETRNAWPVTAQGRRTVVRQRGFDAFAREPAGRPQWSAPRDNVHPSIADY
jgi:hypothetical protein